MEVLNLIHGQKEPRSGLLNRLAYGDEEIRQVLREVARVRLAGQCFEIQAEGRTVGKVNGESSQDSKGFAKGVGRLGSMEGEQALAESMGQFLAKVSVAGGFDKGGFESFLLCNA
ncbi:MAG: hypothetical protein AAF481_05050 [Acidobacteriota bacterium]